MPNELADFGEKIKQLRFENKNTIKDVADAIGVSVTAISSYERGDKTPSIETAKKLALFFDVSLDWLCGMPDIGIEQSHVGYVDAVKYLIAIDRTFKINVFYQYNTFPPGYEVHMRFEDDTLNTFFEEWKKMKELLENDTIDSEVYDLWVEKQLRRMDALDDFSSVVPDKG